MNRAQSLKFVKIFSFKNNPLHGISVLFVLQVNVLVREDDKLDIPEFEEIFAYMVSCIYTLLHWFTRALRMKVKVKMNILVMKIQVLVEKEEKRY